MGSRGSENGAYAHPNEAERASRGKARRALLDEAVKESRVTGETGV
jgi:hypothetical protein